jgi:hypothetical protein
MDIPGTQHHPKDFQDIDDENKNLHELVVDFVFFFFNLYQQIPFNETKKIKERDGPQTDLMGWTLKKSIFVTGDVRGARRHAFVRQ